LCCLVGAAESAVGSSSCCCGGTPETMARLSFFYCGRVTSESLAVRLSSYCLLGGYIVLDDEDVAMLLGRGV
jgi:hypothetical protein